MSEVQTPPNALGFILVGHGHITRSELYVGLREHEITLEPLGRALVKLGLLEPEALTDALAEQAHCPRLETGRLQSLMGQCRQARTPQWSALEQEAAVVVFGEHGSTLYMAMTDARAVTSLDESNFLNSMDFALFVVSEADYAAARILVGADAEEVGNDNNELENPTDNVSGDNAGFNLQEIGYYQASEALFEASDIQSLGSVLASALKHFFTHVACGTWQDAKLSLLAKSLPGEIAPLELVSLEKQSEPFYGEASEHPVGESLCRWVGISESSFILVTYWDYSGGTLVVLGAHGSSDEVYGDLNDVSGLFQEVETALNVLNNTATNG